MTTSSDQRPPSPPPSPARIPPHAVPPRWHGDPSQRPPTDAETTRRDQRARALVRVAALGSGIALVALVIDPMPVLHALRATTGPLARPAASLSRWIQGSYPLLQVTLALLLGLLLIHLLIGLTLVLIQHARRSRQTMTTFVLDIPSHPPTALGSSVDLFAGIATLLADAGAGGGLTGTEPTLVVALTNQTDDHRVRLLLRGSTATPAAQACVQAAASLVSGLMPHVTVRPADPVFQEHLTSRQATTPSRVVGTADVVLRRHPCYPLKDLAMFVGSDPLGPLAAALERGDGVESTSIDLILRGLPTRGDWRAPLRERIAMIEGSVNPEDRGAYEALLRKVAHGGIDVVVRCTVVATHRAAALRQLRCMQHALRTFTQPVGSTRQALHPSGAWFPHRHAGFTITPLTPVTMGDVPLPAWGRTGITAATTGALLGGLLAWPLTAFVLPILRQALEGTANPQLPVPVLLATLLTSTMILAGALGPLALHPRRRAARARDQLAGLRGYAHHTVWPGPAWFGMLTPGWQRSILTPYELAALWHVPSAERDGTFAWQTTRTLPAPEAAFLNADEAQRAAQRLVTPRPATPVALGACRLGLAYARTRSGTLALIGPTLRDLRQGWDTMGGTGSGKSSLIETMVVEIARVGGGCGVIDAKGDLADRLLRILPPEAYDRVVVIDTTAATVPCINPFDRRIIGTKPRDVVAGELGEVFARIEPEIWAGAIGMQQALLMGISAVLEGEEAPTLLHLQRFLIAPAYRRVVLNRVTDRNIRDYWLVQVPQMPEKIRASIESLKRRIDMLIGAEMGQRLLCQPQSTIDLGALIREQGILIIKFVPERIGHTNAAYWSAVIFQSLVSATFQQQAEGDPEQRWDWPLIVDEVQMFVKSERADDAERMWTRTRSMGVGLIGAHQGLNQLGEKLGGIVLNVIGGLCLTSGVRDDVRGLLEAYANQGLRAEDVTGIKAREELLIRFPVAGRDMGLMSAVPRERPAEQTVLHELWLDPLPDYVPRDADEAMVVGLLNALEAGVEAFRATASGAATASGGATVPGAREAMGAEGVYRVVANQWLDALLPALIALTAEQVIFLPEAERQALAWAAVQALIQDLREVSQRRAAFRAEALRTDGAEQYGGAAAYLRQVSEERYGVSPLINACFAAALVRQYEPDRSATSPSGHRQQGQGSETRERRPAQMPPTSHGQRTHRGVSLGETERGERGERGERSSAPTEERQRLRSRGKSGR